MKMSDRAKGKLAELLTQRALMDTRIQAYVDGYVDGLGLEGDWNFDTATLTFSKIKKDKRE